ncbi:MAG TPA: carboxylesterase family protein [Phenylobacterium sp.]|jgi:para-nitrobenzyl esterase|uniref:carboxylesterase/lipase family protein n=1 Tax=Phenylobacterium sp. TaxID=1871053 RepID=UPI002D3DDFC6|nr:carboxylesterase family protein [Phenylobacterium sp.]HZZ69073.1 carboxylesterase family protein [Phenylobacterium sp.]
MADDLALAPLTHSDIVATSNGPVRGYREAGLQVFKGLRYGAAPVGAARFKPPGRPAPWTETADAVAYGAPAIQSGLAPGERRSSPADPPAPDEPASSEDCLFLNVWTPGLDAKARPVMVWLHGGGFANGSGGAAMYDGAALARKGEVVTVTVNHRLNVFGYLHLGEVFGADYVQSGVAGMLDIVQALEWVRDNIAAFGGDPGNVTIFGESGGGWKVSLLMAMPGARGLFHKAVIQSGPGLTGKPIAAADKIARQLLDDLKVKTPADLAALSSEAISHASVKVPGEAMRLYTPVVDGTALPRDPFEPDASPLNADVPVLIGTNKDESTLFMLGHPKFGAFDEADLAKHAASTAKDKAEPLIAALRAAYPDYSPTHLASGVGTAVGMWAGSLKLAERKAAQHAAPVWMYMLTWETPVAKGRLRSPHALEIPLVFDNVEKARSFVGRGDEPQAVADQMSAVWLAFAHAGDPGWPAYDTKTRATKLFDVESRIVNDPLPDVRKVLET